VIVVDCDNQTVYAESEGRFTIRGEAKHWPFAEYAALEKADWKTLDSYSAR
jgi:hypothetical protein